MAPRAQWKGYLKLDEISCQVALFSAASTAERTSFHMVSRKTGNRLSREFVDEKTGKPVPREDQVKGYDSGNGDYVILEPEEVAAAIPEGDKTLAIEAFIPCADIDKLFFDKPYYLAPADKVATEAFALIRAGMKARNVAGLAEAVLFRRVRKLLIRPLGDGLVANTLDFDYEVRSAEKAFANAPTPKIRKNMLDLAGHIIDSLSGSFEPKSFADRYDDALADLVRAKIEGRPIKAPKPGKPAKVVDLMDALRRSAETAGKAKTGPSRAAKPSRRKSAA